MLGLRHCTGFLYLLLGRGLLLFVVVNGIFIELVSHVASTGSRHAEFSSYWLNGLSCLLACGIFLDQGRSIIESMSLALAGRLLLFTAPPGKPLIYFLRVQRKKDIQSLVSLYNQSPSRVPLFCEPMDCSPPGSSVHSLVHGNFSSKNTRVGCHFLLRGIFLTQGSNLQILH